MPSGPCGSRLGKKLKLWAARSGCSLGFRDALVGFHYSLKVAVIPSWILQHVASLFARLNSLHAMESLDNKMPAILM